MVSMVISAQISQALYRPGRERYAMHRHSRYSGSARVVLAAIAFVSCVSKTFASESTGIIEQVSPPDLVCFAPSRGSVTSVPASSLVSCDYRHSSTFEPSRVRIQVDEREIPLKVGSFIRYPAPGQATAALVLFDVSDPRRGPTVKELYPRVLRAISNSAPKSLAIGIGTFSSEFEWALPIRSGRTPKELESVPFAAVGQATEMNRAVLDALRALQSQTADRRVLVLVSDGKSEDPSYSTEDVLKEATRLRVPIVSLGISEKASETPALQTLRKLSEGSRGIFIDLSKKQIPPNLQAQILSAVDTGGRVSFDASRLFGLRSIVLTLESKVGGSRSLSGNFDFYDRRAWHEKVLDATKTHWPLISVSLLIFVLLLVAGRRLARQRTERKALSEPIAELRALDGAETSHVIRRSKQAIAIGRRSGNDLVIANTTVSSRHAEIHRGRDGKYKITDLGSTNGTSVNESKITTTTLNDGDFVGFGEVRFRFKILIG